MDICTTIVLDSDCTMESILIEAGEAAHKPYETTPLDLSIEKTGLPRCSGNMNVNILRRIHAVRQRSKTLPELRISSFDFPKISRTTAIVTLCLGLAYCTIFLTAWNLYFPSSGERRLWQMSPSITIGLLLVTDTMELLPIRCSGGATSEKACRADEKARKSSILPLFGHCQLQPIETCAKRPPTSRSNWHSALRIPLRSLLLTQPIDIVYIVRRAYIIVEDIIGLRSLPASSFQNVNWTAYWPHI
jgi:hypothetical protein